MDLHTDGLTWMGLHADKPVHGLDCMWMDSPVDGHKRVCEWMDVLGVHTRQEMGFDLWTMLCVDGVPADELPANRLPVDGVGCGWVCWYGDSEEVVSTLKCLCTCKDKKITIYDD